MKWNVKGSGIGLLRKRIHRYASQSSILSSKSSTLTSIWSFILLYLTFFYLTFPSSSSTSTSNNLSSPTSDFNNIINNNNYIFNINKKRIEIFTSPHPYIKDSRRTTQTIHAIESWLKLKPKPRITLLGRRTDIYEYKTHFLSSPINMNHKVDTTFLGVPLFNSIFNIANSSTDADIAVVINADIILLQDFMNTLNKISVSYSDYLVSAAKIDVDNVNTLSNSVLHTIGGMDVWAWNLNGSKLFDSAMPCFIYGRGKYDNWFTHETITARRRQVIDVTETASIIHQRHTDYFWSKNQNTRFELFTNMYLSLRVGTYKNQQGSILHAPLKTSKCIHNTGICIIKRSNPASCACEHSTYAHSTQTDPMIRNDSIIICGKVADERSFDYRVPIGEQKKKIFGMPLTINGLTRKIINENNNSVIILSGLNWGYREFMMNFVCNLRRLHITNYIIAAFDSKLYEYGFIRGLSIYHENTVTSSLSSDEDDTVAYGSDAFKELTKMKSRIVLRFLELGINILWCDVDIILFKNPLYHIPTSKNNDIFIQSNAPDDEPSTSRRRLNSGFYYVKSNHRTIHTFQKIITYAKHSRMSEQPCFYDVLCGKKGQYVTYDEGCNYPINGTTHVNVFVLNRSSFANGRTKGYWDDNDTSRFSDIVVLHNNWVEIQEKRTRIRRFGFHFYDSDLQLCRWENSTTNNNIIIH